MKFISTFSSLVFICLFCLSGTAQKTSKDFDLITLDDGVYAAIHKAGGRAICNAGIIDLGTETLVFDPFLSPYAAQELKRIISEMGLPPVKILVNSHFHNDHIRGNQVFDTAKIYSTAITKQLIETSEPREIADEKNYLPGMIAKYDSLLAALPAKDTLKRKQLTMMSDYFKTIKESHKILHTVLPNTIVRGMQTIYGKKQSLILIELGLGHTKSDLIMYLPQKRILFTGDLLFIQNHPWLGDGNLDSLKNSLLQLQTLDAVTLIPGHGPVGSMQDIKTLITYLDQVNETAQMQVDKGIKPEQLKEITIPETYTNWLLDEFYLPNIKFQMNHIIQKNNNRKK
jgi:glyoxylase-like metal-dependent hydrolase (beta-lactamase superfamily II)